MASALTRSISSGSSRSSSDCTLASTTRGPASVWPSARRSSSVMAGISGSNRSRSRARRSTFPSRRRHHPPPDIEPTGVCCFRVRNESGRECGAFFIGQSGVPQVKSYIASQEEHHRGATFQEGISEPLEPIRDCVRWSISWDLGSSFRPCRAGQKEWTLLPGRCPGLVRATPAA